MDRLLLYHVYDVSLISDQVFPVRARQMSSCCVLDLFTSLKRAVQNDGEKGFHCTGRCDHNWSSKYLYSAHI